MVHWTSIPALTLALAVWASAAAAQGGPPLRTDDPGTPGPGRWEVNLAALVEGSDRERLLETPLIDLNYGVGARIQLKFEMPVVGLRKENDTTAFGAGNATVGVKWRWMDDRRTGIACSIYPQLEFNTSRVSVARGLVDEGLTLLMPAEITLALGRVELNGEIGRGFSEHGRGVWLYGIAAGLTAFDAVELLAEVHAEHVLGSPGEVFADAGLRRALNGQMTLLVAIGQMVHGAGGEGHRRYLYGGIQFNLPAERGLPGVSPARVRPR